MLKWSFLICSVPVAFNGVQTRVLVDAPLFLMSNFCQACIKGTGLVAPEFVDSDLPRNEIALPPRYVLGVPYPCSDLNPTMKHSIATVQ